MSKKGCRATTIKKIICILAPEMNFKLLKKKKIQNSTRLVEK